MGCSGSNTLIIGRPTQDQYNQKCNSDTKTSSGSCGTSACNSPVAAHDRKLSPRKSREKVREDIKDYVLLMLGAPVVKIELDQQQLDLAVDQSLRIFEEYAGSEFFDYHTFDSIPGKSVYKMPDDVGIIKNVFYKESGQMGFSSSDLGGSIPLEYFGGASTSMGGMLNPTQPIWGRAGEWVLYKQYEQMFSRISSNLGGWEWVSDLRHIKLYPTPCRSCRVMVHYLQKCKDWKEVNQAMQELALAHSMIMLGHIRSKYGQPPGPGGGMALDGEYMKQKGWELKDKLQEDLIFKFGSLLPITMD